MHGVAVAIALVDGLAVAIALLHGTAVNSVCTAVASLSSAREPLRYVCGSRFVNRHLFHLDCTPLRNQASDNLLECQRV